VLRTIYRCKNSPDSLAATACPFAQL